MTNRPTLVLLHAFPLSSLMYDEVAEPLAEVVDLVLPEFRGFGGTDRPDDDPSLDVYADDVAAVLDRLGLPRALLGGTSMGGYVTMAFCRRHPDRVAGIILADTKAGSDAPAAAANRERIASTVVAARSVRVLLDEVYPSLLGETTFAQRVGVADRVRDWVADAVPESVAWALRAMAVRPDSADVLRQLDVPALVVIGAEDRLATLAEARAMADALPQGALAVLPEVGHLSATEGPAAFVGVVTDWVRRLA